MRVSKPQLECFDFFVSASPPFTDAGAAAIIGNLCQESGADLNPTMFRARPDSSGGRPLADKSGGIAEWLNQRPGVGRKANCIAFSRRAEIERGLMPGALLNDRLTQCAFIIHELKHGDDGSHPKQYATLYRQLTTPSPRTIANLTANFMELYERPKLGPTAGLDNRIARAEAVLERARAIRAAQPAPVQEPPSIIIPAPPPPPPPPAIPPPSPDHASPHIAGMQVAIVDHLQDLRGMVVAERDAYLASVDSALATLDTAIAGFNNMLSSPIPEIKALAPPVAAPINRGAAPADTSQRKRSPMSDISPQALSTVRSTLIFLGGIAVSNGVLDNESMLTVVGALTAIAPAAWSIWNHRRTAIIAKAASLPDVKTIVTTPEVAERFPNDPTVVSSTAPK